MFQVNYQVQLMGSARSCSPSPEWVGFIHQQAQKLGIFTSVIDQQAHAAGSEDATYMMERVQELGGQASYVIFGCQLAAGHHNARFDFDESIMSQAVKTLAALAFHQAEFQRPC